jgi:hypothetical protein
MIADLVQMVLLGLQLALFAELGSIRLTGQPASEYVARLIDRVI